ncbi:MAG: peroxiredoxin [Pseudorhodobacter sp.]|nr:peroxiredoxin [Pseudorhodobacter sp.]
MTKPTLAAGHPAPDFTLPRDGGGSIALAALRPGPVVLYFYPKDDTPGCTIEALDFTARAADFAALGATVIGLSKDSIKAHDKFVKKHRLGIMLVADEAGTTCAAYGTWVEKSMYGRTYMGIERATFLIDGSGRIAQVWRKVSVAGHVDEVLAAVQALA